MNARIAGSGNFGWIVNINRAGGGKDMFVGLSMQILIRNNIQMQDVDILSQ